MNIANNLLLLFILKLNMIFFIPLPPSKGDGFLDELKMQRVYFFTINSSPFEGGRGMTLLKIFPFKKSGDDLAPIL
jgi:hypothetical protein